MSIYESRIKGVMPIYKSYTNQPARNALIIISEY